MLLTGIRIAFNSKFSLKTPSVCDKAESLLQSKQTKAPQSGAAEARGATEAGVWEPQGRVASAAAAAAAYRESSYEPNTCETRGVLPLAALQPN